MKVIAIGHIGRKLSADEQQQHMRTEVVDTLKLYLNGVLEQYWFRTDKPGVVFLMQVESSEDAEKILQALPLVEAGLLTFELLPVGPLLPLGLLLQAA